MSLYDWFRGQRPWRELRILVDGLPRMGSHYGKAIRDDPEVAERVASQPESPGRWRPDDADWDLGRELAAGIRDAIRDLTVLLHNVNAPKGKQVKAAERFPRPVTEIDRAKARAEARIERELDALIVAAHATYAAEHGGEG